MWGEHEIRLGGENTWLETDLHLPRKATRAPKAFAQYNPFSNIDRDIYAPGVREGIPMPTRFAQTQHRNHLFDGTGSGRFPASVNWEEYGSTFLTTPVAQRRAQFWWETLNNGNEESNEPGVFQNTGTWNAAPTGRTALRYIVPASTRTALTPL